MIQKLLRGTCVLALCAGLAACKTSEERAQEYYQSAIELLEQGDTDRAIVQLRNIFNEQGNHYEGRKKLAELLRAQGKVSGAYSQYLRLAEQYPDDLDTRLALTGMAFNSRQWTEFDRHAQKSIELAPDNPDVKAIQLTQSYRALSPGQDNDARRALLTQAETLLPENPDNEMLLNMLVDSAAQNNQLDRAAPLLDKLIEINPGNPIYSRQKLALLVQQGDMSAVEAHLKQALERFPDNTQTRAEMLGFYMSQGDNDNAEAFLRDLVAKAPEGENGPQLDLVRFLDERRGREAARAELDKILAEGGDPLVFQVLRSTFDFRNGEKDKAIADIKALVTESEPSAQVDNVRVALARMMLDAGHEEDARQQVATVLGSNAEHPGALKLQAGWDTAADKTDEAIAALRLAIDQKPEDVEALTLISRAYARAGQTDLSRDYLSRAVLAADYAPEISLRYARLLMSENRVLPAEDTILAALRNDNSNVELLAVLGEIYLAMDDQGRAAGVEKRLREIGSDRAKTVASALELNLIAAKDGSEAALKYLEQLTEDSDGDVGARLQLLRARLQSGQAAEALPEAEALAQENPDNPGFQAVLGMTKAATGDLTGAEDIYTRLASDFPQLPQNHLALYRLKNRMGDADAAAEVLDNGLAALPENPDLLWAKAGQLERAGQIDDAIAIYQGLYDRNSSSVVVANNLASLLSSYHGSDPDKIERAYTIARRLSDTDVPAFMDTYGWILHLRGNSDGALPYLEKAAAALGDDVLVQVHLGLAQAALGQNEAATVQLTKAIDMAGDSDTRPQIEAARQKLAELTQ